MKSTAITIVRLITFRLTREEYLQFGTTHLIVGLLCTWVVGMGRTLHNTRVEWWQHLGLGSVAYVFVLSLLMWLLLWPLRVADLSYRCVLTFVTLTAPTGLIYAFPVESFLEVYDASTARLGFLAVVAGWRVALWFYFLRSLCRLGGFSTVVMGLLPLCAIITTLTILNLDKVVFEFMSGITHPTSDDSSYVILWLLTGLAELAIVPLLTSYLILIILAWIKPRQA